MGAGAGMGATIGARTGARPRVGEREVDVGEPLLLVEAPKELSISVSSAGFRRFQRGLWPKREFGAILTAQFDSEM